MRSLSAKNISCQGWTEKKGLEKLVADDKALGPLLEFLKVTEVGGREGARERELRNLRSLAFLKYGLREQIKRLMSRQ